MPNGLKIKDRNKTVYFYSHQTARVDHHYENEAPSGESGERNEEDSDCKPQSESNSESDESSNDTDEDDSPPCLQEASDDSESGSENEGADETFDNMPKLQVKKIREKVFEHSVVTFSLTKKVTQRSNHHLVE